jgi:hypothetical protein
MERAFPYLRRAALVVGTAMAALGVAPAYADRAGDAPVRAPNKLSSIHAEFTLHGGPWGQLVDQASGAPSLGGYAHDNVLASGRGCRIVARVRATATKLYPSVGRRTVRVRPASSTNDLLRFDHRGRHGAVRWWAGEIAHSDAAAGAVQPIPARLRSSKRRWLVYQVEVVSVAAPVDEDACHTQARTIGGPVVRRVARTLKLADGPPVAQAPFATS